MAGAFDDQEPVSMAELVLEYPDEVADLLEQCGVDRLTLMDYIQTVRGAVQTRRFR